MGPVVELRGISKRFGAVQANDGVNFELRRGEIHALLGENGAGKTTLMNILGGLLSPDGGQIVVDGEERDLRSARDAGGLGIGIVHQHFRLVEAMTVAENVYLALEDAPGVFTRKAMDQRCTALIERFEFDLDPKAFVWRLPVAQQQQLAIVRALARPLRALVLDEPTAVLAPMEVRELFRILRATVDDGMGVVLISHKLAEVLSVADRITVMRHGTNLATLDARECDEESLARLMVGRDVEFATGTRPFGSDKPSGRRMLELSRVSAYDDQGLKALRDVDLAIHAGEIVGIAGVAGNGQRELAEIITGVRRAAGGGVAVDGTDLAGLRPDQFLRAGVGYVPEDGRTTGLAPSASIWRNAVLKSYRDPPITRRGMLRRAAAESAARELCESVQLSTSDVRVRVAQLSGGNSQRLLVGRELRAGSRVLVAMQPTQGLDVGAAERVRRALLDARSEGVAIMLISEDLDEILELADRVAVIYGGRLLETFARGDFDRERIGLLMGGVQSVAGP
jgi:simple sugar transport system ATP-binding protein